MPIVNGYYALYLFCVDVRNIPLIEVVLSEYSL